MEESFIREKFSELHGLWNKVGSIAKIDDVLEYLANVWVDDYVKSLGAKSTEIVQVDSDFSFLFDI